MPDPQRLIRLLRSLSPAQRAAAAALSLPWVADHEVEPLAAELIEHAGRTPDPAPLLALIRAWPCLSTDTRDVVTLLARPRWPLLAAELWPTDSPRERLALAAFAADLSHRDAASWLPTLLSDADPAISAAAESALFTLATHTLHTLRTRPDPGADAAAIASAVAHSAAGFPDHRRPGAIASLIELALLPGLTAADSPLAALLADEPHAVHGPIRALIRRSRHPEMRSRAWRLLKLSPWASACLERLARPIPADEHAPAEHARILHDTHLLANPIRRERLARLAARARKDAPPLPLPSAALLADLPSSARAALPVWIDAAATLPRQFDAAATPLLLDPGAAVRYALLRQAASRPSGGRRLLLDFCFDTEPVVARAALLRLQPWRRIGVVPDPAADRASRALRRSPHAGVRALAAAVHTGVADCLAASSPRARLAARDLLRRDRDGFITQLRARLGEPNALHAVSLAMELDLLPEIELELLTLASDTARDPFAASRAATALGRLNSPAAAEALASLLDSPEPRVRANAAEALARRIRLGDDTALAPRVHALTSDDDHRARAIAVRAALRATSPTLAPLLAMLADKRPAHRLSALWVAERAAPDGMRDGWSEVASRLSEVVRTDPEPQLRARAARVARALLSRFRSDWQSRAAIVITPAAAEALAG